MPRVLDPFRFVLIAVAGWMNQRQLQVIDYLREENRVLREQLGGRRMQLNDDQRRRLASKAKGIGRRILAEVATIVTPETLLAWHRKLIAQKDIHFSNNMIEAFNKTLKYRHLFPNNIATFEGLEKHLVKCIPEYNNIRPHWAHKYLTPAQVYFGKTIDIE